MPCRYYCVKVSAAEETDSLSQAGKSEGSISVEDARQIALNTLLRNMATPELLKQLKLLLQRGFMERNFVRKHTFPYAEAFFQRITELVLENPDLKEERTQELMEDPSFKEIIEFIGNKGHSRLLSMLMSCVLTLTTEDLPLIHDIENKVVLKIKKRQQPFLQEIVDIYEHHQETSLRQLIYKSAVKELENLSNPNRNGGRQILSFSGIDLEDGNSPALQELQGQALMNADKLGLGEVNRVLGLLAVKKIRNMPLIDVLVHRLKTSELHYTVKALKDLLFALCELSVSDPGLMKELFKNLKQVLPVITNEKDKRHVYPILLSCSRLRWKSDEVIGLLVNEILESLSTGMLGIDRLPTVLQSLAQLNWADNETIVDAVIETQTILQEDPLQWLNTVWSLVVLKKQLGDVVPGVLTDDFCQQVEQLISDKPEYVRRSVHTKLLNIACCSSLELDSKVKPANYDILMESYSKANQIRSTFLKKTVGAALQSLNPVSLTANKIVDYGYVLDFEFQMMGKDGAAGEKLHSYGVKLLDYKDMLRTPVVPEPDGQNAMCLRHLVKMGYNLIVVPYDEWNERAGAELKQQYLREKIEAAQIEAQLNAIIDV